MNIKSDIRYDNFVSRAATFKIMLCCNGMKYHFRRTQIPWLFVNNCILIQSLENVQDFTCYYNRFNLHENV